MIHRKEVRSAGPVESITYCDERCIVQIAERLGHVHQFHGVPYSVFYGFPSGPNSSLAIRRALLGKYLYTLGTRADLFHTDTDLQAHQIAEAVAQRKQQQDDRWKAITADQETTPTPQSPSLSASPAAKRGSGKKRLALSVAVPSAPESFSLDAENPPQ